VLQLGMPGTHEARQASSRPHGGRNPGGAVGAGRGATRGSKPKGTIGAGWQAAVVVEPVGGVGSQWCKTMKLYSKRKSRSVRLGEAVSGKMSS
jgi:hypothetical protein